MEPWQSWAVVLLGGGAAYYYYTFRGNQSKSRSSRAALAAPEHSQPRSARQREEKGTRRKSGLPSKVGNGQLSSRAEATSSDAASASDRTKKQKKPKKSTLQSNITPTLEPQAVEEKEANGNADLEFAKQWTGVKTGSSLKPRAPSKKTERVPSANLTPNFSATSSTTGADADDDLSPALSPALGASVAEVNPSGADVSDMLEAAPAGPSVMRIMESDKPQRPKQPQQQNAFQIQETKKQRQNRRKAEEKKLQRQDEEKERKMKLEKQLRAAREARGEPAKNGLATAKTPTNSPWASAGAPLTGPPNGQAVPSSQAPLLDTFDHDAHSTASSSEPQPSGSSATTTGTNWERELPSEEDQMRMLDEQDESSWNTVSKKKSKKKMTNADGVDGVHSQSIPQEGSEASDEKTVKNDSGKSEIPQASNARQGDSRVADTPSTVKTFAVQKHPNDSDWAVV